MSMESCAPHTTRDHRLRPKLSVPNTQTPPGPRNLLRIDSRFGSTSVMKGAAAATIATMPNRTNPLTKSRCRNSRRKVARAG